MTDPTPTGGQPAVPPQPTGAQKLMATMQHIYHTRVRTTTIVLIVVWLGLLAFFGFSTEHYEPTPARLGPQVTQPVQPAAPTTDTVEPTQEPTSTATVETTSETTVEQRRPPITGRETAPAETTISSEPGDTVPTETTPERSTGR